MLVYWICYSMWKISKFLSKIIKCIHNMYPCKISIPLNDVRMFIQGVSNFNQILIDIKNKPNGLLSFALNTIQSRCLSTFDRYANRFPTIINPKKIYDKPKNLQVRTLYSTSNIDTHHQINLCSIEIISKISKQVAFGVCSHFSQYISNYLREYLQTTVTFSH